MWIVKWIVWVLLLLFIIYFGAENSTQKVHINFIKWRSAELQLWIVMYLAFGIGMLVWLFGSIFKVIQLKNDIRKLKKDNTNLRKEVDNLRNISIEEEAPDINEIEGDLE